MLRLIMATCGAIISGSAALAVVDPGRFQPNDVDFYAPPTGVSSLLIYLHQIGYVHQTSHMEEHENLDHYDCLNKHRVLRLSHAQIQKSVNVIITGGAHPILTILQFHSTLVMNYISWYGIVSLFHPLTKQGLGVILKLGDNETVCFAKYEARGYKFTTTIPADALIDRRRSLCDESTLFKPFDNLPNTIRDVESPISWLVDTLLLE